jgi:hypothetical protein
LKVSVISCLGPLSIGMTFEMELELLDIRIWIDSKRINPADLSVAIVKELNRISAKSSSDFMHPVRMEDSRMNVVILTRGDETEFKRYLGAEPKIINRCLLLVLWD